MTTTAVTSTSNDQSILSTYIANQQAAAAAATASSTTSSSSSTAATNSIASITSNFNTFLNILTTQLKNQDPTDATDPNQFTQELVEFSGVEQQINTNTKLDTLISAVSPNSISPLLNYVGQYVEAPANGQMVVQNGSSEFAYTLPSAAASVSIAITDSSGNAVATLSGPTTAGLDRVQWNGENNSGTQVSDGTYSLKLTATDSNGQAITVSDIRLIGKVTGVQTGANNTATLSIGTVSIKDTDIDAVFSASTQSAQTQSSTTGTSS
jgi:flagellar basal-body rod modification protein FlgD